MQIESITILACNITIGILGLTHFLIERRTKEKFTIAHLITDLFHITGPMPDSRYLFASMFTYGWHIALSLAAIEYRADPLAGVLVIFGSLLLVWPTFVVVIKRLRHLGQSGRWSLLLFLLPVAPLFVLYLGFARKSNAPGASARV